MARQKKIIIMPELKISGTTWYIQYSCRNPQTEKMQRFRIYDRFALIVNDKERLSYAEGLINELRSKLENGWTPFSSGEVIYEDSLMYNSAARVYAKMRKGQKTIRYYINLFLDFKLECLAAKTAETYTSKLRLWMTWLEQKELDGIHITRITNEHITTFLCEIAQKKDLSRLTVTKYQQILYTLFKFLRKRNIVEENPVTELPRVGRVVDESPDPIPPHYRTALKNEIVKCDKQLWLCCLLQYYAAIRPGGEQLNLQIKDINLSSNIIRIKNIHAKNKRTESIHIPEELKQELEAYELEKYPEDYYVLGRGGEPGLKQLGKNSLRMRFNKIRDKLLIPESIKLYSWKHTGAQELANNNVSMLDISQHLRHKSIQTTEAYTKKRLGIRSNKIHRHFPKI